MNKYKRFKKQTVIFTLIFVMMFNMLPVNMLTVKAASSKELITDGGFEAVDVIEVKGVTDEAIQLGSSSWKCSSSKSDSDIKISIASGGYQSEHALKVEGTSSEIKIFYPINESSESYTITAWVKYVGEKPASTNKRLGIWKDTYGSRCWAYFEPCYSEFSESGETEWTKIEYTDTKTATGDNLGFYFQKLDGKGYFLIDDVSVKVTNTESQEEELITDGGFEGGIYGAASVALNGVTSGTIQFGSSAWKCRVPKDENASLEITTVEDGYSGNKALKVAGTSARMNFIYPSNESYESYTVSLWVKYVGTSPKDASVQSWIGSGNGAWGNLPASDCLNDWKQLSYTTDDTGDLGIYFMEMTEEGGYFLIDDVSVIASSTEEPTIEVSSSAMDLKVGQTATLTATVTNPDSISTGDITWASSNAEAATVDSAGKVTAVGVGNANITATIKNSKGELVTATCAVNVVETIAVPEIAITPDNVELKIGTTTTLDYELAGGNGTVAWSNSNEEIVTVDAASGAITPISIGTTTITATVTNEAGTDSDSCAVTTVYILNAGFDSGVGESVTKHTNDTGTMDIGTTGWKCWTAANTNADPDVIGMNYGIVGEEARNGAGAMKVSRVADGTENLRGRVTQQQIKGLESGGKYKLSLWVKPVGVNADANVTVNLKDTVNGTTTTLPGKVTLSSSGGDWEEIFYEFTADATTYSIEITVDKFQKGYFLVDDVSLTKQLQDPKITVTPASVEVEVEKTATLTAQLNDPDKVLGENPVIEWSCDNENIATVTEDATENTKVTITAKAIGDATITATVKESSLNAVSFIKVVEANIPLTGISTADSALELHTGSQKQVSVTFEPADASDKTLTWTSGDDTVATVDEEGIITALSAGTTVITATSVNGLTATCTVTVSTSTTLTTTKGEFTAAYGTQLKGNLTGCVTNNTGSSQVIYTLLTAPENGTMTVNADGTFTYVPKSNFDTTKTDSFLVSVAAGTETALLEGEITVSGLEFSDVLPEGETLLISRDRLEEVKAAIKDENSVQYKIWQSYEPYLKSLLDSTPAVYEDNAADNETAMWQRYQGDIISHLLFAYLITEDKAYEEKCFAYIENSVEYPYWGESAYWQQADLPAAHQAFSISIAYNWLKDDMSVDLQEKILNKLYYTAQRFERKWEDSGLYMQNHLWICMSGLLPTTLALYLDADYAATIIKADDNLDDNEANYSVAETADTIRTNCERWLGLVIDKLGTSFEWVTEDGTNPEGAGYGGYGTEFLLKASLLLDENLDIDTFTGNGYYANYSEYWLNIMYPENSLSPNGNVLDFSDGTRANWNGPSNVFRVLAAKYQDETAQWIAEAFENSGADAEGSAFWMGLLFGDSSVEASLGENKSTVYCSEDMGIVVARSDWSGDESMLFVRCGLPTGLSGKGLLKDYTNEYHVDPDCNAVLLFSNGEYLLKSDGYCYKRTANHSTLLINEQGQMGEGVLGFVGDEYAAEDCNPTMTVIEDEDTYSYFVGDATDAYSSDLNLVKFQRNIVFLKGENVALIVDDIKTGQNQKFQLRWFPEAKTVTESYGIYSIYGTKNTMDFYPFTEEAETAFIDVDVYNRSGSQVSEKAFVQNFTGTTWQNAVAFSWNPVEENRTQVKYLEGNANEHKFEVNGKVYTINVSNNTLKVESGNLGITNEWASDSTLSSVFFNGVAFAEFDSENTEYDVERFWKTKELSITAVPSALTASAVVDWNGKCPGMVTITCTSEDKSSTTTYTFNLKNDKGMLSIESATAVPNVSDLDIGLTYDIYIAADNKTQTWSSTNLPVVTYDMGHLVDITKIDVAFNSSSIRDTYYNLLISEDGESWKMVQEEATAKQTSGTAYNEYVTIYEGDALRARYVRLALRGNNNRLDDLTIYNSIQEISFYGVEVPEIVVASTDTNYTLGSNKVVTITSTGEFAKFESVDMDGTEVDESNYTAKEGSTIVTFKTEYLETLSVGDYTVTLNYTDGSSVDSKLSIINDSDTSDSSDPSDGDSNTSDSSDSDSDTDTGADNNGDDSNDVDSIAEVSGADVTDASSTNTSDTSNLGLWLGLILVCVFGTLAAMCVKKRNK